jgi:two-component system cell cycle sensor histidine kinase/response regulator CckA
MTYTWIYNLALTILPCLIPPYAFRLARVFGTRKVGWLLFGVFCLLAVLQVVRSWHPMGLGLDPGLMMDMLYLLVPMLLLIGMAHIESLFKERLRLEAEEKKLRAGLEVQVKERTAQLDDANVELRQEISLRKQGEQELLKSKAQYRFLFDENPQPMWIFDLKNLRFLAFNRATLRHYGYTSAEFRELTARDLCAPGETADDTAESIKEGMLGIRRHCRKDGAILEMEVTAQDLVYDGSSARLVLAHDVTAQRELQRQQLDAQKAEVTAQVAGGVADNFAHLIGLIEADASAVALHSTAPNMVEPLKRIAANAACAADLTRQLLALVRRHPMRAQPTDLNRVVQTQLTSFRRLLGKATQVTTSLRPQLPCIMADAVLIQQILHNLVTNAREAMPDGGVLSLSTAAVIVDEKHARLHRDARPGRYVALTIADTGCGMTPEVQARLFEPFFSTRSNGKASGLGLSTVHGLMQQHSGWVEVQSQPNAGSEFTIYFPCAGAPGLVRALERQA